MLLPAIDPGPHGAADKVDRLLDRAACDAGVDCRLNDLRYRPVRTRPFAAEIGGDDGLGAYANVLDDNVAACRGALAETRPAVDDLKSGGVTRRDRQMDIPVLVDRADMNKMREQRAGRIKFLAVDHEGIPVAPERRLKGADMFALGLGKSVAEAIALKHAAEPQELLLFAGRHSDCVQRRQMILRQLAKIGVSGGNGRDNLGERGEGDARSAISLRY